MIRGFACPECGAEVAPQGLSPGRQVRCPNCSTWVEVPFIPRQVARLRRRPRSWRNRIPAGLLVMVVVVVAALNALGVRNRIRADRKEASATSAPAATSYLLPADSSAFRPLRETRVPYRMTVAIEERQAARYLDTPHRTSQIEARVDLSRAGSPAWSDRLTARTRVPLPMIGAAGTTTPGPS